MDPLEGALRTCGCLETLDLQHCEADVGMLARVRAACPSLRLMLTTNTAVTSPALTSDTARC